MCYLQNYPHPFHRQHQLHFVLHHRVVDISQHHSLSEMPCRTVMCSHKGVVVKDVFRKAFFLFLHEDIYFGFSLKVAQLSYFSMKTYVVGTQ